MGGVGSGRKAKSDKASKTQSNMAEAGLYGSQLIRDYLRGKDTRGCKVKPLSPTKLKACIDSVAHAIGLPKAKIEFKTDALSMKEIAERAASWGKEADVLTIPLPKKNTEKVANNGKN